MIENLKKFPDVTIQEVAEESFTSTTSVTKFCHKIGYQNFYELRNSIGPKVARDSIFQRSLSNMNNVPSNGIKEFLIEANKLDEKIFQSFDYQQIQNIT
jgi:DNA-binding MurR/RpiR family transcriptional regulator